MRHWSLRACSPSSFEDLNSYPSTYASTSILSSTGFGIWTVDAASLAALPTNSLLRVVLTVTNNLGLSTTVESGSVYIDAINPVCSSSCSSTQFVRFPPGAQSQPGFPATVTGCGLHVVVVGLTAGTCQTQQHAVWWSRSDMPGANVEMTELCTFHFVWDTLRAG